MKMSEPIVQLNNVGHWFKKDSFLFKQISLTLNKGETLAILGPNGQGKSTLLSSIIGELKLKEGKISVPKKIAFVPQYFQISLDFLVLDIVLMGRCRDVSLFSTPAKEDEKKAYEALELLHIENLSQQSFNHLSGGQRQLVLLARAIASWSDLIILDEPASALDLQNQNHILNTISMLKEKYKTSVIFTTHQPNHALAVADKTLMMMKDLSYKMGYNSDVINTENLSKLYGIDVELLNINHKEKTIKCATPIFTQQR